MLVLNTNKLLKMKQTKISLEEIHYKFGGVGLECDPKKQKLILEALQLLPETIIDKIISKCWFVSTSNECWAFTIQNKHLNGKQIIFLSEKLFTQPQKEIYFTILHECAHALLNHKSAIFDNQTEQQDKKQENQANKFANKYLEVV